jgi:hypothetical protein
VVWINGIEVVRRYVPAGELAYNALASNHDASWEEIVIPNPASILIPGTNIVAVHALNTTIGSSDFSIDLELRGAGGAATGPGPTPGAANTVYAINAPP